MTVGLPFANNDKLGSFRNHTEICCVYRFHEHGLLRSDYGEFSSLCVFIKSGDSVVLVILTAVFLSLIVGIEWDNSRLAASVNFPTGVTVHVVCPSDGWLTNAVIVFVVIGGTVVLS